ncbi:MAG: GntR family transcriptional regulator [Spirochaetes bacterium]|nr:GntR family transcriptional regulator [Spirochaetota bacterium]
MKFDQNKPIYLQIVEFVMESILTKQYQTEERIPSVRELAVALEVNQNTILKAYEHLENESIIYKKRGIGYFVDQQGYDQIMNIKRAEFIQHTLPDMFKNMQLLNISLEDLKSYFQQLNNSS